jgi:integrase
MTLMVYAAPLRKLPVDQVDTEAVLSVLKPLWEARHETASRLRGRIETVLNAARAKGHRSGENPARWRGHLDALLAKRNKATRAHHAAMPYADVPALIAKLGERPSVAALALEFIILTASRSGEVFGAKWPEFNLDAKVWTIPAERMKAGKPHAVPLSARAVEIVKAIGEARVSDFVFPGRSGQQLTAESTRALLHRVGVEDATTHGFRSSFRDWAGNETHHPREVIEHALAHREGDAAEQSYRRSDALEKRRALMVDWAAYCEPREAADNVTQLPKRA